MENGARRREDARRFASFCAGAGSGGISALVRAIDAAALAGSTGQDIVPGGSRPGCVTVMTIHRSKGLQFPVVFVADTARRFNAADTRQPVLLHRMYGAGLRLRPEEGEGAYKTAAYTALSNVHAAEMRSEQMRLLYVALTRAQDKLILTVPLGIGKTSNPFTRAAAFLEAGAGQTLCRQANSFADWLRAALLVHPNGGPLRRLAEDLELPFADTGSTIALTVQRALPEGVEPTAPEPEERPLAQADPALTEALRQGFAWQYPAAELARVPAKVSVTGIVHKAEQTTLERPGFLAKDGLTAAEMGTALHAFLEHADFAALAAAKQAGTLETAIPAERDRQVEAKLTASEIAEKLMQGASAALWRAKPLRASVPQMRCCGSWTLSRPCLPPRCWPPRGLPPPTALPWHRQRCWCRASLTWCWCSRITWSCWITRQTAENPRTTSLPPIAPSLTSMPLPSASALPRNR